MTNEIEEMKKLLTQVSVGDWRVLPMGSGDTVWELKSERMCHGLGIKCALRANAEFIARARDIVPTLIERIEMLEAKAKSI